MGQYYFLMCMLPPVPEVLGESMPLGPSEITDLVTRNIHSEHLDLVSAQLNSIDTLNWEQMDQGRGLFFEGGMLTREEMENGRDLPDFIKEFREEQERGINRSYPYDRLWELYYRYAQEVAEHSKCSFLVDYLSWETELRSSLAETRVREAGGTVEEHAILDTFHLHDYSNLINQLKEKENPLEEERFLDEERLRQIYRLEGSSCFTIDALLAYLSRMMIYSRWERISKPFDFEDYLWTGGSM